MRPVCTTCRQKTTLKYEISKISSEKEKDRVREFVKSFWGEEEQLAFDKRFKVADLPGYVAKLNNEVIGFASYSVEDDSVIIVALGVAPRCQGAGLGSGLIKGIEDEATRLGKVRLLVATSNDDLPALGFYQSLGFQIYEVRPNVIAEKHGKILNGLGGLPIRDELRMRKTL